MLDIHSSHRYNLIPVPNIRQTFLSPLAKRKRTVIAWVCTGEQEKDVKQELVSIIPPSRHYNGLGLTWGSVVGKHIMYRVAWFIHKAPSLLLLCWHCLPTPQCTLLAPKFSDTYLTPSEVPQSDTACEGQWNNRHMLALSCLLIVCVY